MDDIDRRIDELMADGRDWHSAYLQARIERHRADTAETFYAWLRKVAEALAKQEPR